MKNEATQSFTIQTTQRLDQCIVQALKCSRSQAVQYIKNSMVRVEEKKMTKPSKKITEGSVIHIKIMNGKSAPTPSASSESKAYPIITILYEDDDCIVIDKPAGITVHPGTKTKGESTIIEIMREQTKNPNLHLVHRLDKETTGCLLIAKNTQALEELQKQFKDRTVRKTYLAIVTGIPEQKKATIDAPIGRSLINRVKMSLFRTGTSRNALTDYEVLDHTNDVSLLRCKIHTGRTHQIRVHLAGIGHPIIGDVKYGKKDDSSLMLHAEKLTFKNPDGEDVIIKSDIPKMFLESIAELELEIG